MRLEIDMLRLKYRLLDETQSSDIHILLKNRLGSYTYEKVDIDWLAPRLYRDRLVDQNCRFVVTLIHQNSENLVSPLSQSGEFDPPSIPISGRRCRRLGKDYAVAFPSDQIPVP